MMQELMKAFKNLKDYKVSLSKWWLPHGVEK